MRSRVEACSVGAGESATMGLTVWLPAAGTGPGLLLIQEIYGVSDYIRAVAEDLAGLGYLVAAQAELDAAAADLGAVVSFYGSLIPGNTDAMSQIRSPMQLHFGGSDPYIPREQVAQVEEAAAGRPNVEMHVEEDAGHAFHNRMAPMFHVPEPAARAWRRTEEFLQRHLPTREKSSSNS